MKTVYNSTNFNGGVMRPLEVMFELDDERNRISFTTLNISDSVYGHFYAIKEFSGTNGVVYIESFNDTPTVNILPDNLNKIALFKNEFSNRCLTKQYTDERLARINFNNFVEVIKSLRGNDTFGPKDISITSGRSNKSQPTQNKESYMNTNLTQIGTEVLSDNKEFAIFEAERVTGLAALEALEKKMIEVYPGTESFWKSKLGTFFLCNGIHAAGKIYDGPQANIVHETTKIVMRGCYAKVGQAVNLNGFIEGVFESIISVVPGMKKTTNPEPPEMSA